MAGTTMRTLTRPVKGTEVRVEPATSPGIRINGIPATLDAVCKADRRVDLADDEARSFIVEHALAPLGLLGITAAEIVGRRDAWSFERPEHRFCYSTDLTPEHVVGHPAGLPNPAIVDAIDETTITGTVDERRTISEAVEYTTETGHIRLAPASYGAGLQFDISLDTASFDCTIDPAASTAPALVETISTATTPYLDPTPKEAIRHTIADLVADIGIVGGFDDLNVTATLGGAYHALTIGVARRARRLDRGVIQTE